jgi:hypothetical protein
MDTDDFSEKAYDILIRAARVSDTLKAELAVISSEYNSEDEWLQEVKNHLKAIINAPEEYVDYWSLQEAEGVSPEEIKKLADYLFCQCEIVLATPSNERNAD